MQSPSAATDAPRFGKYALVARLATGGMAEIFLARLQGAAGFEKLVCIKRILPHLARDKQFVAMFLDEARIAAQISHPNVCQVFELGELEGSYYIAMEYLEGVPLACFRRPDYYGQLPDPRLVAGIAVQACEGLHHAHQLKNADGSVMEVVHRDISPQNLFVTVDGIVKVLDFGIAKIQDARIRTSTGAVKGTYAYMAPEQLRGERVDRRIDVFAMGIVLWETLTRRHLFKRETEFLTFQAITGEPIEDVCALRPDVPPALSAVILTALSRDREQRFPTARILGEAIAQAMAPFHASAISEEIARAFPAELAEQAELLRVARGGGAFDLEVERGPSVGHGTELMTTPISKQRGIPVMQPMGSGSSSGPVATASPTATTSLMSGGALPSGQMAAAMPPRSGAMPAAPPTGSMHAAMPVAPRRRSWLAVAIAALAIALGGVAAYVYAVLSREGPSTGLVVRSEAPAPAAVEPKAAPPAEPRATPRAEPQVTPPAEPTATPPAATDAAPKAAPPAAPADPRPDAKRLPATAPDRRPPRPSPASAGSPSPRAGPPGYITIDSTPVYAVIYIDGKNYGETPLVRLALPPGRHTVHAVAPSGATRDVRITIESGKVAPPSRIEW